MHTAPTVIIVQYKHTTCQTRNQDKEKYRHIQPWKCKLEPKPGAAWKALGQTRPRSCSSLHLGKQGKASREANFDR